MKSQMILLQSILREAGLRCCTCTNRDYEYIAGRVEAEGMSYLTISLPQFGKDLLQALDQGGVDSTLFAGYRKRGCLPALMRGFTSQIFDTTDGLLLDVPNIDAIHSVLQATQLYSKVNLPCSDARVLAAITKYVECEQAVDESDSHLTTEMVSSLSRVGHVVLGDVFSRTATAIYNGNIIPKHGPGATADKLRGNEKFAQTEWPDRMENLFPAGEWIFSSWSHYLSGIRAVNYLDPGAERPVRVITVPKTLKTPRIIAVEPTCMQYAQQAIMEEFVKNVETDDYVSHFLGFDDQEPNQFLAKQGSTSGALATLDLSEASDRVSNQHVLHLTCDYPYLSAGLQATRSTKADVPGFGIRSLSKFASMGSALCFPIEASVFLTMIFIGIEKVLGKPISRSDLSRFVGRVRVYGDDIVVPVEYVQSVIETLEAFGLKVNRDKSFWTGKFRESCGKEYYDGIDVSIVKVRQMFPTSRRDTPEIISTVSLRNQLYHAGYTEAVAWLDKMLLGVLGHFPVVYPTSPALGRHDWTGHKPEKTCPYRQIPLVRGYVVREVIPINSIDDDRALLKYFLKRGDKPLADGHMERSGRPQVVNIKLGWIPIY